MKFSHKLLRPVREKGLVFYTTSTTPATFDPSWTTTGAVGLRVNYGDGSGEWHATGVSHIYAAPGTRRVVFKRPPGGWSKLLTFDINSDNCCGPLPSLAACPALTILNVHTNAFSGAFPSPARNTALGYLYIRNNAFSGTMPDLSKCTLLKEIYAYTNSFTGRLPDLSANTLLQLLHVQANALTDYAPGSLAVQKSLALLYMYNNQLPQVAVDAVLHDCVTSLSIGGRVACNASLGGTGNAAPSAAGLSDKAVLVAAGWTVTTN